MTSFTWWVLWLSAGIGLSSVPLAKSIPGVSDRSRILEPGVKWLVTLGGPKNDWINRVIQTKDGGIVAVGFMGRDPDAKAVERWTGAAIKYSPDGKNLWSRELGTGGMNAFWAVHETASGQLVIGGFSTDAPVAEYDAHLTMLGHDGKQIAARSFGGPKDDRATDVLVTRDGGYLLIGQTESFGAGERDVMLVKTDKHGVEQWRQAYGGPGMDRGFAAVETADSGVVVAGTTGSEAKIDGLVFKVDKNGRQEWWRTLPADHNVIPHFVNVLPDGRILVTGYSDSWNAAATDFLAVTFSTQGNILRIETLGGAGEDHGITAADDRKGGVWLVGYSKSFGTGVWNATLAHIGAGGSFDPGVIVLNRSQESFGTTAVTLADDDVIVGGYIKTSGPASSQDLMLTRIDPAQASRMTEGITIKRIK